MSGTPTVTETKGKFVPLDYHIQVVNEIMEDSKEMKKKMVEALGSSEGALKAAQQELNFFRNAYPDISNIHKGYARFYPNSFDNAMSIVKDLFKAYRSPWTIHARVMKKKYPPFWQIMGGIVVLMLFGGAITNPVGASKFVHDNSGLILGIIIIFALALFWFRRKKEKPATL